jgi:hypothetical protein
MKSKGMLLLTWAVAIRSVERIKAVMASVTPYFADYLHEPKEIDPEIAERGVQKLINSGVFSLVPHGRSVTEVTRKNNLPKRERHLAHHGGGDYYSGYV